ncbi:PilW family protein [Gallaecimonas pentaromativorans]|uniref:Type IV pilus assembly protein PilW n=1 Tax=Gallaecimonas pentaromativorans TaxID=584787 RepID=A0A3N1P1U1_9GAMM|nr:PilW family protein [Gallaecimonas pentaromativorans]ROQ22373.1 type IV pilus assembly protein PilW [Gallaecimonas pentaromativorans]
MKQRGFSLIELMIAMTLGLVMAAAISAVFVASKRGVRSTEQVGELQENASFALRLISEDLRQANMLGPMTGTPLIINTNTELNGVTVQGGSDCLGGGVNNASLPRDTAPAGSFLMLWGGIAANGVMTCLGSTAINGTDILQVKRLAGPVATAATWQTGKVYLLANNNNARFWLGSTAADFAAPPITNGEYWPYLHHVYYLANEVRGTTTVPVLKRRFLSASASDCSPGVAPCMADETLVEGVERFHILYGIDTDDDAMPNFYASADNVTDADWIGSDGQRVVSARIYVLVRTVREDSNYTSAVSYTLGDQAAYTPGDHFRRLLLQTTVTLPNPQYLQVGL